MPPHPAHRFREYNEEDLALFAKYVEQRALFRPRRCKPDQYEKCWVRQGPPAILPNGKCVGCKGLPMGYAVGRHHGGGWKRD